MTEQHPFVPVKQPPVESVDRLSDESARPEVPESPAAGIILLVAAMMVVPVMDGLAKHLSVSVPPLQVVWARYFFHFILFLPFVLLRHGWVAFRPKRLGTQVFRGVALFFSTCCYFIAISQMPLADAIAVLFVYPFVVTALSPLVLGDAVGAMRWAAVSVGFAGALLIIRPGFETVSVGTLLALGAGSGYATYVLATRRLKGADPAFVTLLWTGVVGTLASSALMPFVWVTPSVREFALMMVIGGMAAGIHYMIILAYERATAPQLAPFGYVEIVSATTVGYLAFGDLPDSMTWIGIAVIVASGLFIAWREVVREVGVKACSI